MLDCLILHVPKFQNKYRLLGNYTSIQWMTQGIFALADALNQEGLHSKIIHLGLEKNLNSNFRINKYVESNNCKVAAFSIQFHQQLYDSLCTAKSIKKYDDSIFIVLGGMTATYFAREILDQFAYIDAVITGEGEKPLVQLVKSLKEGKRDLDHVPNLLWRRNGMITLNQDRYVATQEDLDKMDFCNLSLLEHFQEYVCMPKIFSRLKVPINVNWKVSKVLSHKSGNIFFALPVGRGCVTNCAYCGGGINAHRILSCRNSVTFRSQEKVIESIHKLKEYNYDGAYVSFDPLPLSDKYYQALFSRIRQEKLDFRLLFSAWALPSPEFIEEYRKTFASSSFIAISPETGSEILRKKVRGIYYSNKELLNTLKNTEENNIETFIFFSLGLPGETSQDFEQTLNLKEKIENEFQYAKVSAFAIEIEPMALCHQDPEKYGIKLIRKNLSDFLEEQKNSAYSSMSSLGYYQQNYLGKKINGLNDYEKQVLETKCQYFCDKKLLCQIANYFWNAAEILGLSTSEDIKFE